MKVSSCPFHSFSLEFFKKVIEFLFSLLKLSNKERKEYYNIIIFISFLSSKRALRAYLASNQIIQIDIIPNYRNIPQNPIPKVANLSKFQKPKTTWKQILVVQLSFYRSIPSENINQDSTYHQFVKIISMP